MKNYLKVTIALLAIVVAFFIGMAVGKDRADPSDIITEETIETTVDTIPHIAPIAVSELETGTNLYAVPVYRFTGTGSGGEPRQCTEPTKETYSAQPDSNVIRIYGTGAGGEPRSCIRDSAIVELPIIQRHYADSTYEAWVSGPVDPKLDSLKVYARTTTITKREWKPPKKWHIGVTAGYGYSPNGFQPYIGVGITYSIFSF